MLQDTRLVTYAITDCYAIEFTDICSNSRNILHFSITRSTWNYRNAL